MGATAMRVFEYYMECDQCGYGEVMHTGDMDHNIRVHSLSSAIRACQYHKLKNGKILCHICYESYVFDKTHKK